MGKDTPNTCKPSKSHTSESHPYRHVDEYAYDSKGNRDQKYDSHGLKWAEKVMDSIDRMLGSKKK